MQIIKKNPSWRFLLHPDLNTEIADMNRDHVPSDIANKYLYADGPMEDSHACLINLFNILIIIIIIIIIAVVVFVVVIYHYN